jgi:hypothetical protein
MLKPTDKITRHPQAILNEEFEDWAILFHPLTGEAIGASQAGVAIWKELNGPRTVADIAASVTSCCEVDPSTALEDTLAFLDDLQRKLFVLVEP